jgi:hypothetical protein
MNHDSQKALVLDVLARREQIASETRHALEERAVAETVDPLAGVDPAVRRAAEDEFYAAQGRHRYETSDGRTLFLTPEEIAQRRRARGERARRGRHAASSYSALAERNRWWLGWGFYGAAVVVALGVVWLILR